MGHYNDPCIQLWARRAEIQKRTPNPVKVEQTLPAAAGETGKALFAQACTLHQQGNADLALQLYQQALRVDPGMIGAWRNLGALLRASGGV